MNAEQGATIIHNSRFDTDIPIYRYSETLNKASMHRC